MNKFFYLFLLSFLQLNSQENLVYNTLFQSSSQSNVSCFRIPSLATTNSGVLLAVIDERVESCSDLRDNQDINIVMKMSWDNGKKWSEEKRLIDYPFGESASDPSMIVDKITNEIFLFFNYMNHKKNKNIYKLKYIKSKNDGKTWTKPKDITDEITDPNWNKDFMFITSGKGYQSSDGQLLHTIVNLDSGTHVFGSKNHGKTWFLIKNPISPGDESKIIELRNKNWMVNSRVNGLGHRYSHITNNKGKTWISKASEDLIDPGCNASLIRYNEEILLFSNISNRKKRENLTIKLSYDEGISWPKHKTIYSGSAAYSSLSILKNGEIGVLFEMDNYKKNVFVKFPIDWIDDF